MLRARDTMDRAFARPLDVPALARIAHVSPAHFSRQFRATFGETPHRYLQRRRVERAMELLRETERSVTEVCLDVGFNSLGTFSRTFRDVVGESPSAYRLRFAARRRGVARAGVLGDGLDATRGLVSRKRAVSEKRRRLARVYRDAMLTRISHTFIYVLDQDEALDFYVGKLGMVVNTDADLGTDALAHRHAG